MELSEQDFLEICKTKIEEKYHLGKGDQRLKQRDFEYLIDLIEEKCGTKLSISTLKRLWRETEQQNPHPSTLDALVSILGNKDWMEFKVENAQNIEEKNPLPAAPDKSKTSFVTQRKPMLMAAVFLAIVALIVISFTSKRIVTPADAESVAFNVSNTVESGVPTTVIFNYDLKDIQAEKFFIQQDWDPDNRQEIDPASNYFTSVYYYPGFHKARIYADETLLKMQEVFIRTEGWLAAAVHRDDDTQPVYLSNVLRENGALSIPEEILPESGLDMNRFGGSGFFNIGDFGNLDGHNFIAETRFKNRPFMNSPCPFTQFTIHTEANIYFLKFTSMGCVGELALMIGEKYISGNDNDLSAFGTDLSEWQEVSLHVEQKYATILLNGEKIYEIAFENDFGKVVGVDYRFSGFGDLDYLRFKNTDETLVFEDDF
ncbi:hypothetical protein [Rhodohalobacter sp. 614A]|uniref:hypothetical protein n=1 Tax=Rhodohalobacter sp. 614A TaxID=2908649 RepID=UPI001F19A735|nr:hypothetical protein [Rhodohalobacter sp. 614A]